MQKLFTILSLAILTTSTFAQQGDVLLNLMKQELSREMDGLRKAPQPPYYIDYRAHDVRYTVIESSFGSLLGSKSDRRRMFNVTMRLGDYQFDNTHQIESASPDGYDSYNYASRNASVLPAEDAADAIRMNMWQATQQAYNAALKEYRLIRSPTTKTTASKTPDFTKELPSVYFEAPVDFDAMLDRERWEKRTREYSGRFLKSEHIVGANVTLNASVDRQYFVSTEGSEIVQNSVQFYLYVSASVRAEDGDVLPLHKTYFSFHANDLPTDEVILRDIDEMIRKLNLLRTAPVADPYSGPAILHAQTAGVFFHEIFGHRVEGHRLRDEMDGQTFRAQVRQQVLPEHLNVIFDPTIDRIGDKLLNGSYKYDNEGVKAQRVLAVEKGVLKQFLMSRTPLDNFLKSNGHGRSAGGAEAVSRQSNLIVETTRSYPMDDLRKMLIRECRKQGKKYGYLFKDVMGGFTNTDRFAPNAFNIFPTEVYRVYVDGRPDELVRGVDLIGTPLAMFAEIAATGDKTEVFHGFCGAESGNVPVSAVAPALFVKRIETQKKPKAQQDTTLIARPSENK